jgi:hypothetical protein
VVGILEFVCGLCLRSACSRGSRPARSSFSHRRDRHLPLDFGYDWEEKGIEYPLFWTIVVFHFLVRRRAWSLDRWIGREI